MEDRTTWLTSGIFCLLHAKPVFKTNAHIFSPASQTYCLVRFMPPNSEPIWFSVHRLVASMFIHFTLLLSYHSLFCWFCLLVLLLFLRSLYFFYPFTLFKWENHRRSKQLRSLHHAHLKSDYFNMETFIFSSFPCLTIRKSFPIYSHLWIQNDLLKLQIWLRCRLLTLLKYFNGFALLLG